MTRWREPTPVVSCTTALGAIFQSLWSPVESRISPRATVRVLFQPSGPTLVFREPPWKRILVHVEWTALTRPGRPGVAPAPSTRVALVEARATASARASAFG